MILYNDLMKKISHYFSKQIYDFLKQVLYNTEFVFIIIVMGLTNEFVFITVYGLDGNDDNYLKCSLVLAVLKCSSFKCYFLYFNATFYLDIEIKFQ